MVGAWEPVPAQVPAGVQAGPLVAANLPEALAVGTAAPGQDGRPGPVVLEEATFGDTSRYGLSRIYRLGPETARVAITRSRDPEYCRAHLQIHTAGGGWLPVLSEPADSWHPHTPAH